MNDQRPVAAIGPTVVAKFLALRALWRMFRYLRNWREVWAAYRAAERLPALTFRRGFVLHHGLADDPVLLLHSVFALGEYRGLVSRRSRFLVDIGANIGAVTLDRVWGHDGVIVHAYEPNPATFATLQKNVQENGLASRVQVFPEAVSARNGAVLLWTGESSVLASTSAGPEIGGSSVSVPTVSLDCAIGRIRADRITVKIDAEGAEVEMLESASESTLAAIDEVALEYHDSIVPGARMRCHAVLSRAGFTCWSTPFTSHQGILVAKRRRSLLGRIGSTRWVQRMSADNLQ